MSAPIIPDEFMEWFRKNYPGPETIIHKPDWHAPRVYRAAIHAARADICDPQDERVKALEAENARLREALTPSGDTKAAYIGEFSMPSPIIDEHGDEVMLRPDIPWTTIKEIMAAIRARAALRALEQRNP